MTASPFSSLGRGLQTWRRTTFAALAVRDFRLFYIGQGMSLTGTWARRTALGWYVYEITGSYKLLGAVMALSLLPLFVLAPVAGSLADHLNKRHLIIASQIMALLVSATLAATVWTGVAGIMTIMVLAFLGGVAFSFEVPARQAYVVEMVGRDRLMNAIALNSALVNLTRTIGPVVAGGLMYFMGVAQVFALDALSYLVVLGTLLALRTESVVRPPSGSRLRHLADGVTEAWRNQPVRNMLALLFLAGCFGWSFNTLMPAIAQDYLALSELKYGILMAMFGAGAIVGALYVAGRADRARPRVQVYGGLLLLIGGLLIFSLMRNFYAMTPLLLIAGFGGIMFLSTANTIIQTSVEDGMRGRVMGLWSLTFGGSLPLGSFLAGWTAEWASPFATIQAFTLLCLAGSTVIFLSTRHQLMQRLPTQPEAEPEATAAEKQNGAEAAA